MKKKLHLVVTSLLGVGVGITLMVGVGYYRQVSAAPNYEYLDLFTKVLHFVQNNYVEEVDSKKLMEGAIKGMLATLDPHTVYLPAEQFKEMQVDTSGKFGGLGIEISIQEGFLTVMTPIEDTPAYFANVQPGDKIVLIEDKAKKIKKSTKGMTLQEAVNLMRGEKGTKVTIHVARKGEEKLLPIEIKRDIIKVVSVKGGLLEKDYAWLRVTHFQAHCGRDLRAKIEKLIKENGGPLQGAVLDLRSNPGGLLEEAVSVSGLFVDKEPIVSTMGRSKAKREVEYSTGVKPFKNFRMVVLVNEASASASEIVAGALQDLKRAIVIGKPTFGKGSVQTVIDLENHSGLKLTVARYYTPSGRSIQSKGIVPDIEVERLDAALVEQAKKGKILREADLENHILGENENPDIDDMLSDDGPKISKGEKEDKDKRPIKEKDGRRIRIEDPKELLKTDFQLQQSLSYLKAWKVFQAVGGEGEKKKTAAAK